MNLRRASFKSGFTLLELLAVLAILALIIGIAAPAINNQIQKGRVDASKVQLNAFEQSLNSFNLDCGFFPSTEQGLEALISAPTIGRQCKNYDQNGYSRKKSLPQDPWSSNYIYTYPGQNNPGGYDLSSPGPDGVPGNEDDITNWN
jgi:general secretion pathway protein G